ncbi:helix-turn-helix domain-containing protein [Sulfitobacter sp. R18_1]|uniref:helix-turn-helix domain-containing protein n=1 Tax=Sulfitobacter sp. R18_1 TaxID=2821104 RepID=UPI001ADAB9BE|nr:helix-turn-helix domain-containing protein [Sulfitobacter sp. R18_1]MBO9430600.1 helix-turn-helix domain-containing protein [Sulfitobacter sp. R18_1]
MSGIALIWAANVKGLKPAAKVVLIQLADFHNKQTNRCDPSAQRLADECEMSRATVFRHLTELENLGLVSRQSKGDGSGGRGSNQYELHLDVVLGPSSKPKEKSQNETGGVVSKNEGKSLNGETGVVSNCDTNLTIEPGKNHCVSETATHTDFFDQFWEAHPRPNDETLSKQLFEEAVEAGADPAHIVAAAVAYEAENTGNSRQYLKMSDNWLAEGRWKNHRPPKKANRATTEEMLDFWAERINSGKFVAPSSVNPITARALVDSGRVPPEKLKERGIAA